MKKTIYIILLLSLISCGSFGKKPTRGKDIKDTFKLATSDIKSCYQRLIDSGHENNIKDKVMVRVHVNDLGYTTKVERLSKHKLEMNF